MAEVSTVRVYNKSTRRSFIHEVGKVKHSIAPSSFLDVPQDIADRWLALFPGTIVEGGVAAKELGGAKAELAEARKKIAELEAQLAAAPKKAASKKDLV